MSIIIYLIVVNQNSSRTVLHTYTYTYYHRISIKGLKGLRVDCNSIVNNGVRNLQGGSLNLMKLFKISTYM